MKSRFRRNGKSGLFLLLICVLLLFCACGRRERDGQDLREEKQNNEEGRLTIVATLFPQYDFARQIAGEYGNVVLLLPPGMESHSYDLRPADMITIKESDMLIYTGQYMETWAQTIIDSLDGSVTVVDASKGITLVKEEDYYIGHHDEDGHEHDSHEGHQHEYDPHIWTDPVYAIQMVRNITEALCAAAPEHTGYFRENAEDYIGQLEALDAAFSQVAAEAADTTIYFGGRFAMTYFIREYGFDCVSAYHDCSAESEPSIASVMKIIDEMKEHGAKAVYYEELADPKVARTIAEETGAQLILLHSAHNVTKREFDGGITYLDIMWQNVENLKEGLY